MKKIITFGNCQQKHLRKLLATILAPTEFDVVYLSNTVRVGQKKSNEEIIAEIMECDILMYQPLQEFHGELYDENIKKVTKPDCIRISFPYFFNNGVYSLCHAPESIAHEYGKIYGEEIIIDLLNSGKSKQEIIEDYTLGKIDFNLQERFNLSLAEMKRREENTHIKSTDFIEQCYKKKKLFITHNHPSNLYFYELLRQILILIPLPTVPDARNKLLSIPDLFETNCPVTPHDVAVHGYQFGIDPDWVAKGTSLIELIVDDYLTEQGMG